MSKGDPVFLQAAEEFCSFIEHCEDFDRGKFAACCLQLVSRLLTEVSALPETPLLAETHRVDSEEHKKIVNSLKSIFADKDRYRMVFDPYANDENEIYGSLSDDLSDTWSDMKLGLESFRTAGIDEAVGKWRFSFVCHWGVNHAINVLKPLLSVMLEDGCYREEEKQLYGLRLDFVEGRGDRPSFPQFANVSLCR